MILVSYEEIVTEALAEISIPVDVKIVTELDPDGPKVIADFNQLVMACRLIITNALQAMSDGGQLTISSRTEGRDWVVLSIADTGIGIPAESIDKIFEPLFTTKAQGIGLGLPIAKSLVDSHKGSISVQSEVDKGTVFSIKLPCSR
jgi:signal transduction histidine kinase